MKIKKFFCFLVIFLILFNVCYTGPANAFATEIIGGTYVTYAILAAALAAAGYTVATSDVSPEVFQGILDSPNSELVKALIGTTSLFVTSYGNVFFNWSSSQWSTFVNWANTYLSEGSFTISSYTGSTFNLDFNGTVISDYVEPYIRSTTGVFAWHLGAVNISTFQSGSYIKINDIALSNGTLVTQKYNTFRASKVANCNYFFGSPLYVNASSIPCICFGQGTSTVSNPTLTDVTGVYQALTAPISSIIYNSVEYTLRLSNNIIYYVSNNVATQITGTVEYPIFYNSIAEYVADVINTGSLVGDFTGLGDDVINPASNTTDVSIDVYPDNLVGEGDISLPLDLDIGGSLDIPLDRYIDTPIDLSQDPVPIDFTPWQDKTIDTTPDDVIPDVRINPPADVTANPDTPWADEDSFPLDYPTDTTTDNLPPGNNPNPDPGQDENTNRLKLGPLLLSKFPFCLPWDLQHGLKVLVAPAEAPQFTIPFVNERLGINTSINIDLSFANTLARVSRWFLSALWVVILILITSKIIWK